MKIVDARGQMCPRPLILTRQALKELSPDDSLRILIDNATSRENVERFLSDNGMTPQTSESEGVFTINVQKTAQPLTHPDAESYCATPARPHIIVFSSDSMGRGSDELGEILMKAFVNTIREAHPLPSHLVFYNRGILLAVDGSAVLDALKELESRGVVLLVCGTCVNFFEKKDSVRVGTISNMYTILETMTAAGHIVQP